MRKTRTPYPPEFRQKMVDLVLSGRSPEALEKEFGSTARARMRTQDPGARMGPLASWRS